MADKDTKYTRAAANSSSLLTLLASRRAEEESRRDLEMEYKIAEGTASYDDQIEYLESKTAWYFKGTSKYQSILNDIQSVEEQRDETDLQYRYKIKEIDDNDLLTYRQDQLAEVTEGSAKYYALQNEIYEIQSRLQQKTDSAEYQQALLDYKFNYTSADDFLTYLQSRLEYMQGDGAAYYTDEEVADMELQVAQQQYVIADLADEMEALTQDLQYENGVDRLESTNTYIEQLEGRLAEERDPVERIRIQGQIDAQRDIAREIERDRTEAEYRIQYARAEITDEDFYDVLAELAENEVDPDKKLQYELEAGKQYRSVQEKQFSEQLQAAENEYALNQDESEYLARLETLKDSYGEDSKFGFQLDSMIATQTRKVMNDTFSKSLASIENAFELHKDSSRYLTDLENMKAEFGDDSIFSFKLDELIASATGDTQEAEFNAELSALSDQLLLGEITESEYQEAITSVYGSYEFAQGLDYQTKLSSILASSEKNEMEDAFNSTLAELENMRATGQLNDIEYQSALESARDEADSKGYGSLLNIPAYSNRLDSIISSVEGSNMKEEMSSQLEDIKNRYAAKDTTYREYLQELEDMNTSLQEQNPGLYSQYFKSTMNALIADAKGDTATRDFNNSIADLKRKLNNSELGTNSLENAKAYKSAISEMLGDYGSDTSEWQDLQDEISSINEEIVSINFTNDVTKLQDAYELNPTASGLSDYLSGLERLASNSNYSVRDDLLNKINSQIASAQGNLQEANFMNDLSKQQKRLLEGKITASEYQSAVSGIKDKYFGEGVEVQLDTSYLDAINMELKGEQGSTAYKQFSRRLAEIQDNFEKGNIELADVREKLINWQGDSRWGSGDYISNQIEQQLTTVETNMATERYESYAERQQKRLETTQEAAARTFRTAEQEFEDIQAQYGAGKTSFEAYEEARKRQAEAQQRYEDYLTTVGDIEIPEFEFEAFRPDAEDYKDIEIEQFSL